MFTTTHLTMMTTSNHKGMALCGHIILPGCDCTPVVPVNTHGTPAPSMYGRSWAAQKHHTRPRAAARLNYFQKLRYLLENQDYKGSLQKRIGTVVPRAENFGDLIIADHQVLSEGCESQHHHRHAVVVQDLSTQWIQSY